MPMCCVEVHLIANGCDMPPYTAEGGGECGWVGVGGWVGGWCVREACRYRQTHAQQHTPPTHTINKTTTHTHTHTYVSPMVMLSPGTLQNTNPLMVCFLLLSSMSASKVASVQGPWAPVSWSTWLAATAGLMRVVSRPCVWCGGVEVCGDGGVVLLWLVQPCVVVAGKHVVLICTCDHSQAHTHGFV